jgi:hypothetical protein
MKQLLEWTTEIVRNDDGIGEWLEERKLDWIPIVGRLVKEIMKGTPVIIITDKEREWFGNYFITKINSKQNNRPFVPFYKLDNIITNRDSFNEEENGFLEDMLNISYSNYIFFYIGKEENSIFDKVYKDKRSIVWLMDSDKENSFYMSSIDKDFDCKLLNMFRLLNLTITASMFSEVEV